MSKLRLHYKLSPPEHAIGRRRMKDAVMAGLWLLPSVIAICLGHVAFALLWLWLFPAFWLVFDIATGEHG